VIFCHFYFGAYFNEDDNNSYFSQVYGYLIILVMIILERKSQIWMTNKFECFQKTSISPKDELDDYKHSYTQIERSNDDSVDSLNNDSLEELEENSRENSRNMAKEESKEEYYYQNLDLTDKSSIVKNEGIKCIFINVLSYFYIDSYIQQPSESFLSNEENEISLDKKIEKDQIKEIRKIMSMKYKFLFYKALRIPIYTLI
jgi:hypothetical protein